MKRIHLLFVCMILTSAVYAQLSAGLIAHWTFNGNTFDSTGNGHNGTSNNITYGAGKSGIPNSAAIFNGTSSYISTPYKTDLNVTQYSICAVIKPMGFYTGTCQTNAILWRGTQGTPGSYTLHFYDNAYDGADCNAIDTSKNVFTGNAGTFAGNESSQQYIPTIVSNNWYNVVLTFKQDTFRTYVNGLLKSTFVPSSGALGTSSDSLFIGAYYNGTAGLYPYWLKAYIDDLRLYNRALTAADVNAYNTLSTGDLNIDRTAISLYPNPNNGKFTIKGSFKSSTDLKFDILNAVGQIVYRSKPIHINKELNEQLNVEHLASGTYVLRIQSNESAQNIRFVVDRD